MAHIRVTPDRSRCDRYRHSVVAAAIHTEPPSPKAFTADEVQEAKTNVCNAYSKVDRLIRVVGRKNAGTDDAGTFAVAVNSRLGMHAGAQYLQTALENNPAAPPELAEATTKLIGAYYEMAVDLLGDAPDEETNPLVHAADDAYGVIRPVCK